MLKGTENAQRLVSSRLDARIVFHTLYTNDNGTVRYGCILFNPTI